MILQLTVRNFALIENEEIEFTNGFNVIYGETGAGKSILIDAIDFVTGGKYNKDIVRTGCDKSYVEAVFSLDAIKMKKICEEFEIEFNDVLIISREMFQSGKSIIKINGKTITLSVLRMISKNLIDIHGQHENSMLFDKENYLMLIDSFDEKHMKSLLEDFTEDYIKLRQIQKKIEEINNNQDNHKMKSFLEFQIDEIEKSSLRKNEDIELQERFSVLQNSEKISSAVNISYGSLKGRDDGNSIIDQLYYINKELSSVESCLPKLQKVNENIMNAYYSLEDCAEELRDIGDEVIFDGNELEDINTRLFKIDSLKKKYGSTIDEIFEYLEKIKIQCDEIENSERIIEELKKEELQIVNTLLNKGHLIHERRLISANKFQKSVYENLKYMGLERCNLVIEVTETSDIRSNGIDTCEFLISTNPGEPLKPLNRVASGGEISRIMLAVKAVLVDKDKVPTVIFDEIDTGISGRIAQSVGEKMYEISIGHQVFCITHLPQIACFSDNHYLVQKEFKEEKTFSCVKKLKNDQKVRELAKMLGGKQMMESSVNNAISMIDDAEERKKVIKK